MAGPTPWCNWVIRGQVLAGAYPASTDDKETDKILTILLEHGMEVFVCLQAEVSLNVPESMWRAGRGLRPYMKDAQKILTRAREYGNPRIAQSKLNFLHLAIIDGSITTDRAISRLAEDCCDRVRSGEKLYIHCWGGHGRTGTLVALMLAKLYGLSCGEALKYTQAFHDARRYPQNVRSPQTAIQRTQVRRLLSGEPVSPQPITKGQGLLSKGQSLVGTGQDIVGSLASGATAGLLSSAAPRSMAAAVTRTSSALRRSRSPQRQRAASPLRHSTSLARAHVPSAYAPSMQMWPSGRMTSSAAVTSSLLSVKPQVPANAASPSHIQSCSDRIAAIQGGRQASHHSSTASGSDRLSRSSSHKGAPLAAETVSSVSQYTKRVGGHLSDSLSSAWRRTSSSSRDVGDRLQGFKL
ncbi:hypothetical protein WJX77_012359 [Trebouxia sp. C0004]